MSEEQLKLLEEQKQKMLNLLELARKYKQEGNELFKAGDLKKARTKYSRVFPYTKTLSGGAGSDQMVAMAMKVR